MLENRKFSALFLGGFMNFWSVFLGGLPFREGLIFIGGVSDPPGKYGQFFCTSDKDQKIYPSFKFL